VAGKRVLVREDLNVPMKDGHISDDSRVRAAAPTLQHLAQRGARVVVMSHLGRPKDREPDLSLKPVVADLGRRVGRAVQFAEDCIGESAISAVDRLQSGQVLLLENVRFHKEDESNDSGFARRLASLGDVFVNDAFAASHRAHASVVGVAAYLPAYAGELMQAELAALHQALDNPRRPMVAVVGGAKVSTKVGVLRNLLQKVDALLIGGAMANTFFKARGWPTGAGLVEDSALHEAEEVAKGAIKWDDKLAIKDEWKSLPSGVMHMAPAGTEYTISEFAEKMISISDNTAAGHLLHKVGRGKVEEYMAAFNADPGRSRNGPVGVAEIKDFSDGTRAVGEAIAGSGGYTLVGGGDTVAAIESLGLAGRFSHVSTGGGATLEYLEGKDLPGVAILKEV